MTTAATAIDDRAAELLRELAGPGAAFREHQLEAVRDLVVEPRARAVRAAHGLGQVGGLLPRHRAGARGRRRPDADRLAAAGADAQPDRGGGADRDPRAHGQLDQPRRVGRGAGAAGRRRRRRAADQPRAAQQPDLPRRDAAAVRRAGRAAGGRRGALHLRLGPRLPPRLPADRRHARAAAGGRAGAVHDRDRQRPRGDRRRGAAERRPRRRAAHLPRAARAHQPALRGRRPPRPGRPARLARPAPAGAAGLGDRLHAHQARRRPGGGVAERPRDRRRGLQRGQRDRGPRRGRGAAAAQRPQGGRRHQRAGDGLRQARPRLRRALPGAGQRHLLLPAGRPRGARDRARRGGAAARPRGPPDPGLLHRAGVPAPRARRPRARADRRRQARRRRR